MNIAKLAEDRVRERGEYVSITFEDREITNVKMVQAAKKLGHVLKNLGVKRGDRVILQMPNCPEVLQGFQAVWEIGAGVMHSHYSLYANARMQYETIALPDGLTSVSVLPLCHSYGIATMNNGLFRRGKTVLLNSFNVETILASIEKYRANIMAGVPTMYVFMLLFPELKKYDIKGIDHRTIFFPSLMPRSSRSRGGINDTSS
ncbi:MAG: AMP-binding protein [Proteobacteria bacterium]|nr:AMP-binding protein [Pseudomonadota bacterium]